MHSDVSSTVEAGRKSGYRSMDYGVGSLVVIVISVGVAAIVYTMGLIPFDLFNVPAWIFGPWGIYTLVYSVVARKDSIYYMVWGAVISSLAVVAALYNAVSPFIVLGILVIVIAVIGVIAYWRGR